MKELKLQFSDDDARRLERAAKAGKAESLSTFARGAIMERVIYAERHKSGHFPQRPHPSAFRRQGDGYQVPAGPDSLTEPPKQGPRGFSSGVRRP